MRISCSCERVSGPDGKPWSVKARLLEVRMPARETANLYRVALRRDHDQANDFQCICPFGLHGKRDFKGGLGF